MASSGERPERDRPSGEEALESLCSTDRVAKTVARVAMVAARELELARIIDVTLDQAVENLGAAVAYVCTVHADETKLLLAGHRHLPSEVAEVFARCGFDEETLAARAAASRRVQIVNEAGPVDPKLAHAHEALKASDCSTMVAVPLLSGQSLVGVLTYGLRDPVAFRDEDHAVVEIIADVLATGIAKAQAYEAERRVKTQLEGLRSASLAIAREYDLHDVLQQIVDQARRVAGARYAALGICRPDPEAPFDPWVYSGVTEEEARAIGPTPRPVGLLGAVARGQQTIRTPDVRTDARYRGLPANHPPMTSFLGVAVQGGQHGQGNLYVADKIGASEFSAEDVHALELFAQHAAIALAHAYEHDRAACELAERTRAEAALRESEQSLAFAQRVAGIGSWEWDPKTGGVRWSAETYRICGRAPAEGPLSFEEFVAIVHPDDRAAVHATVQRAFDGVPRDELYVRIRRSDGAERVVRQVGEVVFDDERRPIRFVGTIQDVTEQRQAELAASRLAAIVTSSADAIVGKTLDGVITEWNPAAERQFGWTAAEMIGRSGAALMPEGERTTRPLLDRVRRGETIENLETRMLRSDGSAIEVSLTISPIRDATGRISGVSTISRDVGAQKRAREALRRSEEQFRLMFEEAPIGVALVDLDGRLLRVNKALCEMSGYADAELLQLREQDLTHPDDVVADGAGVRLSRASTPRQVLAKRYLTKGGGALDVEVHASVVHDARGAPVHYVSQIIDVSHKRRAEQERERLVGELEAERAWLRAVIDRSPVAIILVEGTDAPSVTVNRYAEELFGESIGPTGAPAGRGRRLLAASGEPVPAADLPGARALRGEIVTRVELLLVDERGERVPLIMSAAPIEDGSGGTLGAVLIAEDVTAQKSLERLREEWISIIAHDLRQPVTSISVYAGMHARRTQDGTLKAAFEHILANAHRLNRMIADLLDVSRLESQRLELQIGTVDVVALARESLERMSGQTRDDPLRIVVRGQVPRARVDPQRFEQVLGNLVSNAVKYGDAGAPIEVEIEAIAEEVRVSVINRGPGIPEHELGALFERFGRTGGARRRRIAGLGLGLYITRGIVEAHGGRIWAESKPGATTAFRFTLPVAVGAEATRESRDEARDSLH